MASSSTSLSVASSSSTHRWKYDVFLSFRGEDTRKSFTDHLHEALRRYGIKTFIDDHLRRGEQISPALLQAIEESRFSIIIFSQHYASSSWCLDELIKILECVKLGGHTAFPVFYNVDPSHVRKQTGSFAGAFEKHEQVYRDNMEKVQKWREALTMASGLSGWDSRDRHESKVIKKIVSKILKELIDASSSNMEGVFGMNSRIQDMVSLLCTGLDDVRMVGIWGMAGIGKTTIAKFVYEKIRDQFEGCCFLSNVREKSQKKDPADIQMELLSQILGEKYLNTRIFDRGIDFIKKELHSMKVLIVLDDVNHCEQLEALAGNHDWFGPGSRIILTTRDKRLLIEKEVDEIYVAKELDSDEALRLFHLHAFRHKPPTEDLVELCYLALDYTKGIPLALKILGCFLYNRSKKEWESELKKLRRIPNKEVQDVLRISFDGLDDNQKDIFLDIACFFKGQDKDDVAKILKSCDFFPEIGINILIEKSLITISNNKLWMHDLIQEMGWEIVRQESKDPGKRSRLWVNEDVKHVLTTNTGTEAVEGIVLDLSTLKEELHFSVDVFTKMNKLRVLTFCNGPIAESWKYLSQEWLFTNNKLHLTGDFKFLSNNLRYLYWHGYPLKSLPSNFHPEKLLELNMCFSRLEQLWKGNQPFQQLKFIELSHSQHLIKTPDFSGAPKLRTIILEGCTSLVKVHPSIGALKKLIFLNLKGCKNLKSFLSSIHMESLQILTLSGCSKLMKFPEVQGNMDHLSELSLEGTAIKGLPLSIENLNGLVLLKLKNCKKLASLPKSICKLTSLQTLILSGCSGLKKLSDDIGSLQCLEKLLADGSGIQEVPTSITLLTKLQVLSLAGCKGGESKSRNLALSLHSSPTEGLRLPFLSVLYSLRMLNLSDCNLSEGALPSDLSSLSCLECLDLSRNSFITVPANLSRLSRLERLLLEQCKSLQSLPELPSSIEALLANDCRSLETFSYPSSAHVLTAYALGGDPCRKSKFFDFEFSNCFRLVENEQSDTVEAILLGIRLVASIQIELRNENSLPHDYDAVVPGSSIPEWFIHQSVGCSVNVELPPNFYSTKLMGFACCVVFDANITTEADHIWFGYRSLFGMVLSRSIDHLEVSFAINNGTGEVVKKCGVRLLFEQDVTRDARARQLLEQDGTKNATRVRVLNQENDNFYGIFFHMCPVGQGRYSITFPGPRCGGESKVHLDFIPSYLSSLDMEEVCHVQQFYM